MLHKGKEWNYLEEQISQAETNTRLDVIEADIELFRLRIEHTEDSKLDKTSFNQMWNQVTKNIVHLADNVKNVILRTTVDFEYLCLFFPYRS